MREIKRKPKQEEPDVPDFEFPPITCEGRTFRLQKDLSAEQDMYNMALVVELGLDKVDYASLLDEDDEARTQEAKALIAAVYRSGKMFHLLAGALVQDGVEWEDGVIRDDKGNVIGHENARFFARTKDREFRNAIEAYIVFLLISFFALGTGSSETSPNSLALALGAENMFPPRKSGAGGQSNSGSGSRSSAKSRKTTRRKSSTGKGKNSAKR